MGPQVPERFLAEARHIVAATAWRHSYAEGLVATSTRGRTARQGGVAFQDGAAGRAQNQVTRPGFQYNAQIRVPTQKPPLGAGGAGGGLGAFLDLSQASTWRMIAVGLALAYVVGFHVTLGGFRLGLGPRR